MNRQLAVFGNVRRRGAVLAAGTALVVVAALSVGYTSRAQASRPSGVTVTPLAWSHAVTHICGHALLFEGSHQIGTRAGAVAVARDMRSSTERRLRLVAALPTPAAQRDLATRWRAEERRLAAVHASSYLRIFNVIAGAKTPRQKARAARLIGTLVHAPDRLAQAAARLEARLHVPDCTGGAAPGGRQ